MKEKKKRKNHLVSLAPLSLNKFRIRDEEEVSVKSSYQSGPICRGGGRVNLLGFHQFVACLFPIEVVESNDAHRNRIFPSPVITIVFSQYICSIGLLWS